MRPLTEKALTGYPKDADVHFLVGFPRQARNVAVSSFRADGNVAVEIGAPLLPVYQVAEPPNVLRSKFERFYAKVPITRGKVDGEDVILDDIDGMSGGPIFAVKEIDGRFRYWAIAVQSGWARQSRVLAACYTAPLVYALKKMIDGHRDEGETDRRNQKQGRSRSRTTPNRD